MRVYTTGLLCFATAGFSLAQAAPPAKAPFPLLKSTREVKSLVNLKDVAWGAAADGLQAGIRIQSTKQRFHPGERVSLDCYLRNTTDHAIALTYTARIFQDELPEVHDLANPAVTKKVTGVFLTGLDAALSLLLKPGEAVVFPHQGLGLGEKQVPVSPPNILVKGLEQYPYFQEPTPGAYTIQQTFRYHLTTPAEVKRLADRSHQQDRVIIEPMAVTLLKPDGASYRGEVTVIPFSVETSTLITGGVHFGSVPQLP